MSQSPRVRFAPSPTGKLHIGGARTALFNWAYARRSQGRFLLRVEDTDRERSLEEHEHAILEGLRWLGLQWDEGPDVGGDFGPYRQSERIERHRERARELEQSGAAYPCFCSPERLTELREAQQAAKQTAAYDRRCRELSSDEVAERRASGEAHVLRFRVPDGETRFVDHVRGEVTFQNREVDDWIMVRADGSPTYNFVVVCDDNDMGITHVLRGEEHLVNTPKQVLLYAALGERAPEFGHLPLMLGADGKKLSKRTGDTALQDYRDQGYPALAVANFLCLQGWALDGETEKFGLDQLIANFEMRDVSKGGSIFDIDKLNWLAGEYLREEPVEELAEHCLPHLVASGLVSEDDLRGRWDWFLQAVTMEQERMHTYADIVERTRYLFSPDDSFAWLEKAEKNARKHGEDGLTATADFAAWLLPQWEAGTDPRELRDAGKEWIGARGLKFPVLFQPLRCALTGFPGGPDLYDTMSLLGLERTRARIESGLKRLRS